MKKILAVDVGGSNVKVLATGEKKRRKIPSGRTMTPEEMVRAVKKETRDWEYDRVTVAYPGAVMDGTIVKDPHNLGPGWQGFNFQKAFGCKTRVLNDAAAQALGSYEGGSMLFLGLGTGLGAALVVDGTVVPLEIAHLPFQEGKSYEYFWGKAGHARLGDKKWEKHVHEIVRLFRTAFVADDVVLGGGEVDELKALPEGCRAGKNSNAFKGCYRVWE